MMRRIAFITAIGFVLLAAIAAFAVLMYWRWAIQPLAAGSKKMVRYTVKPGAALITVGEDLERLKVIRSSRAFRYLGRETKLRSGVYDLSPAEPPAAILQRLAKGDFATVKVTFPEGFTVRQIALRLKKNSLIADDAVFLKLVREQGGTLDAGFPLPRDLEGYLFPDTYRFPVGTTDKQIAERMVATFENLVVDGLEEELRRSGRSLHEVVTVASMVEREAETDQDRPLVAGVIYNRLKKGMRLQIDATVQYARGVHENRLLYSHLEVDSPYNTYKNAGLPPGPICCPGLPSLKAAISPRPSEYLFYVDSGDGSGNHTFARTYAEHQRNVAQYRKRRREARRSGAAGES